MAPRRDDKENQPVDVLKKLWEKEEAEGERRRKLAGPSPSSRRAHSLILSSSTTSSTRTAPTSAPHTTTTPPPPAPPAAAHLSTSQPAVQHKVHNRPLTAAERAKSDTVVYQLLIEQRTFPSVVASKILTDHPDVARHWTEKQDGLVRRIKDVTRLGRNVGRMDYGDEVINGRPQKITVVTVKGRFYLLEKLDGMEYMREPNAYYEEPEMSLRQTHPHLFTSRQNPIEYMPANAAVDQDTWATYQIGDFGRPQEEAQFGHHLQHHQYHPQQAAFSAFHQAETHHPQAYTTFAPGHFGDVQTTSYTAPLPVHRQNIPIDPRLLHHDFHAPSGNSGFPWHSQDMIDPSLTNGFEFPNGYAGPQPFAETDASSPGNVPMFVTAPTALATSNNGPNANNTPVGFYIQGNNSTIGRTSSLASAAVPVPVKTTPPVIPVVVSSSNNNSINSSRNTGVNSSNNSSNGNITVGVPNEGSSINSSIDSSSGNSHGGVNSSNNSSNNNGTNGNVTIGFPNEGSSISSSINSSSGNSNTGVNSSNNSSNNNGTNGGVNTTPQAHNRNQNISPAKSRTLTGIIYRKLQEKERTARQVFDAVAEETPEDIVEHYARSDDPDAFYRRVEDKIIKDKAKNLIEDTGRREGRAKVLRLTAAGVEYLSSLGV
ncbi:hypothetical protein BJ508DRAFT_332165 [Ascobolus immersus RN42]|uniref:Uncharacterized protein n=1 Tax=Ascobolus immersus RN42 TaxID=1160509 RepID=A0A3N4HNP5_ASCIM|nr:hypothetical protein BJ508DRAFT_332165 [Ascobolus immersus RN42]